MSGGNKDPIAAARDAITACEKKTKKGQNAAKLHGTRARSTNNAANCCFLTHEKVGIISGEKKRVPENVAQRPLSYVTAEHRGLNNSGGRFVGLCAWH